MELFLSLQDPRQLPKGTRDPLGFEVIWTKYGREVIGNLTTITSSIEEFLTALLGFYLSADEDTNKQSDRFIRYEQIAAYLRQYDKEKGGFVRGVTQASKNLQRLKDGESISVSASKRDQILSSQKSYGLWGLYSTALNDSGLIENRRVIGKGIDLVENIEKSNVDLMQYLNKYIDTKELKVEYSDIKKYSPNIINLLEEHKVFLLQLVLEGKGHLLQKEFFNLLSYHKEAFKEGYKTWDLIQRVMADPRITDNLKSKLVDIQNIDLVLAVINTLFDYMRLPENRGKRLSEIAAEVENKNHIFNLELPNKTVSHHLATFVNYWNAAQYEDALREVCSLHKHVMERRNSGYWVEEYEKKIKIQIEAPKAQLKLENNMHSSYSYFIGSMFSLYKQFQDGQK